MDAPKMTGKIKQWLPYVSGVFGALSILVGVYGSVSHGIAYFLGYSVFGAGFLTLCFVALRARKTGKKPKWPVVVSSAVVLMVAGALMVPKEALNSGHIPTTATASKASDASSVKKEDKSKEAEAKKKAAEKKQAAARKKAEAEKKAAEKKKAEEQKKLEAQKKAKEKEKAEAAAAEAARKQAEAAAAVEAARQQAAAEEAARKQAEAAAAAAAAEAAAQQAPAPAPPAPPAPAPAAAAPSQDVYYENCDAVRAAGVAPLQQGQPGYSRKLDRDGDGYACE